MKIEAMADGTSIAATQLFIKKGTQFGPFVARKIFSLNPSTIFPLKVFCNGSEDFIEYYLDTSDENECNWMYFIQPASNSDEQNLICFQVRIFSSTHKKCVLYWMFYVKEARKFIKKKDEQA